MISKTHAKAHNLFKQPLHLLTKDWDQQLYYRQPKNQKKKMDDEEDMSNKKPKMKQEQQKMYNYMNEMLNEKLKHLDHLTFIEMELTNNTIKLEAIQTN